MCTTTRPALTHLADLCEACLVSGLHSLRRLAQDMSPFDNTLLLLLLLLLLVHRAQHGGEATSS